MASKTTLVDLLQNADQLFDESKYQETVDVLNNFEVSPEDMFAIELLNCYRSIQFKGSIHL